MKAARFLFLLGLFAILFANPAGAADYAVAEDAVACPAQKDDAAPPDFTGPGCETLPYWTVNPQGRELWMKTTVNVPASLLASEKPLGVFVFGKASTEVWLNGKRLGRNGVPAYAKKDEVPGRMDAVFYAPRDIVREGANDIVVRMSSHYGFLRFHYPTHWVALGVYSQPTMLMLEGYWPSLIPFGALIAGALYFAAAAFSGDLRRNSLLLALMSLFAAGQLFAEVFRGLYPYAYPAHEWRMLLIVLFSLGFGVCLIADVSWKFMKERWRLVSGATALVAIAAAFFTTGYDGKAGVAVLAPAAVGAVIAGIAALRRRPQAVLYFVALTLFVVTIILKPNQFLNVLFFYEVAGLLLVLFIAQAFALSRERKRREDEQARAGRLELSLERARQNETASHIKIKGAGKIDVIPADEIAYCQGAGDYVEIFLNNGREILHNGSLTQLEEDLPATFLRVHRSYLVNTNFVRSLTRDNSGVGQLLLTTDATVPVSRRIMPKVRSALN